MRRSENAAYSEFVSARSASLYRTAYLVLGDHYLAQDLLQEALLKAYVAWPRIRDLTKAEAYTRKVIVNTAISWRRRSSFSERPADHLSEDASASDQADELATRDALWFELQTLPPRQRATLVLRYFHDLSESQTAELMGCSVGTVKRQVFTALRRLRERLGPQFVLLSAEDEVVL